MALAVLVSLLYGLVWGALWGILEGLARRKGILASKDFVTQIVSSLLWGGLGYFVAFVAFGTSPYSLLSLFIAIPLCIVIENRIQRA